MTALADHPRLSPLDLFASAPVHSVVLARSFSAPPRILRAVKTFKAASIRTGIAVSISNLVIKFLTFVVVDCRVHCSLLHKLRALKHRATARAVTRIVQLSPGASALEPILDRPYGRRTLGAANAYRHTTRALRPRRASRMRRGVVRFAHQHIPTTQVMATPAQDDLDCFSTVK